MTVWQIAVIELMILVGFAAMMLLYYFVRYKVARLILRTSKYGFPDFEIDLQNNPTEQMSRLIWDTSKTQGELVEGITIIHNRTEQHYNAIESRLADIERRITELKKQPILKVEGRA